MAGVTSGVSILVGAGIGVGLMYLLDPEVGEQRRRKLQKGAASQFSNARGLASSGLDQLHDAASKIPALTSSGLSGVGGYLTPAIAAVKTAYDHLGDQLHGHVDDAKSATADAVASGKSQSSDAVDNAHSKLLKLKDSLIAKLQDNAHSLSEPVRAKYASLLKETTLALGRDEDHHYVSQTVCALSSLALGAGLVYFFDSDKGHDRRDNVAASISSSVKEIGSFFRKIGTRIVHQGQSAVEQASDHLGDVKQKAVEIRDNYLNRSEPETSPSAYSN